MYTLNTKEKLTYFATVFITGAAVLIVEVAAVRQLTPVFGGSIHVLSSVLSVILLALSIGYFIGGRLADRYPSHNVLYYVITASGLSLLLLQLVSIMTLYDTAVFSLIIGPIFVALGFFFVPALLLGMDSPYVIKLITHNSNESESGKYVGTTFFWSTIGSITGSLLAGFVLIPYIGVNSSISYTALVLITLGLVAPIWLTDDSWKNYLQNKLIYIFVVIALSSIFLFQIINFSTPPNDVLFQTDGLYSKIMVRETEHENRKTISLRRDLNNSSAIFPDSYEHVFAYSQFADLYDDLVANPDNFLLIGGGAYSIPRRLVAIDPEINVDVVEIEPVLFSIAQKYFDLKDTSRINNYLGDARIFLLETDKTYDVIFSDAFNTAHSAPWQLGTTEFYEDIKKILNPEGVFIINYIGALDTELGSMTSTYLSTIKNTFPHLVVYQSQTLETESLQNLIFIASQSPIDIESIESIEIDTKKNGILPLSELYYDIDEFNLQQEGIFSDNLNSIENLMAEQFSKFR